MSTPSTAAPAEESTPPEKSDSYTRLYKELKGISPRLAASFKFELTAMMGIPVDPFNRADLLREALLRQYLGSLVDAHHQAKISEAVTNRVPYVDQGLGSQLIEFVLSGKRAKAA